MERCIIEVDGDGVGILCRESKGYRFITDRPAVLHLNDQVFETPEQVERLVASVIRDAAA